MAEQIVQGDDELPEIGVQRQKRPTFIDRVKNAPSTFATGTVLPRLQGLLNPVLYRERQSTDRLVDDALEDESSPLYKLKDADPIGYEALRRQAEQPMSRGEHQKFRSHLLGLVEAEIDNEEKVRSTLEGNAGWFQTFSMLNDFIPGSADPKVQTREEVERDQIVSGFQKAQQMAVYDPEGSRQMMADVRKQADAFTANVRTQMERDRKVASFEDNALFKTAQQRQNEGKDLLELLQYEIEHKGLKDPNAAIVGRAMSYLGSPGSLPTAGIEDAAGNVGQIAGAAGGARGNIIEGIVGLGKDAVNKFTQKGALEDLQDRVRNQMAMDAQSYVQNRSVLGEQYNARGLQLGEQAGEVYSIANVYDAEGDKLPKSASPDDPAANENTLRQVLTQEQSAAAEAVAKAEPEASANMPGAAARLAAARERAALAADDLAIFEDDLQQRAAGAGTAPLAAPDAPITQARARRQARDMQGQRSQVRKAIQESLSRYMR